MDKLLKDLEAVALLAEKATPGPWVANDGELATDLYWADGSMTADALAEFADGLSDPPNAPFVAAAVNFLRTHHAEIAEAVADARRWRASHFADAPIVTVTGEQLRKGIRPGDYAVPWDWPITAKTKIRLIAIDAQHNSAGEGSDGH